MIRSIVAGVVLFVVGSVCATAAAQPEFATTEGDFIVHDFTFKDGETLKDLRLH